MALGRRGAILVALTGLYACGGAASWQKPGAGAEDKARDVADCQFLAQGESLAELIRDGDRDLFIAQTRTRRLILPPPGAEAFRYLRQGGLFDGCMERRGYGRADTG